MANQIKMKFDKTDEIRRSEALVGIAALLEIVGRDLTADKSVTKTPERFVNSFLERMSGYDVDVEKLLETAFPTSYDEMIVLRRIEFNSTCEHHLLPFVGYATVGYIPADKGWVVGISKLARLVDAFSQRLQIQENLTEQIADALDKAIRPKGTGVIIEAVHQCMSCRGVKKRESSMVTSIMRGVLRTDVSARQEFMRIAGY